MPRTTLDLDGSVLRQVRRIARETGKSIGQVVSELVAAALGKPTRGASKLDWRSQPMRARVDLEDKDAVYRALGDE
jgi:hypothetical protein